MPRPPRFDAPGALHHVWARGLDRQALFLDAEDREFYLATARRVFARTGTRCLAWCLMTNHVHFAVESGAEHLSRVFHAIHTCYAKYFNRRHGRTGYLFERRFKSKRRYDGALGDLVAYVHLNPVGTSLSPTLADLAAYPWSGHRELLGLSSRGLIDVEGVLRFFGPHPAEARSRMNAFLAAYLVRDDPNAPRVPPPDVPLSPEAQADLPAFGVEAVDARAAVVDEAAGVRGARALRRAAWDRRRGCIERLLERVCAAVGADAGLVRDGRRTGTESKARALLAFVACDALGLAGSVVARLTGTTRQAIPRARARGRRVAAALGLDVDGLVAASFTLDGP